MKLVPLVKTLGAVVLMPWALTGCIIYPRLGYVYTAPELQLTVVDSTRRPLAVVKVTCEGYPQPDAGYTDAQGRFCLPAHRVFRVLDMLAMDPARASFVPVVEAKNGTRFLKTYHYYQGTSKQTITDTLVLNSKSRAHYFIGKGW